MVCISSTQHPSLQLYILQQLVIMFLLRIVIFTAICHLRPLFTSAILTGIETQADSGLGTWDLIQFGQQSAEIDSLLIPPKDQNSKSLLMWILIRFETSKHTRGNKLSGIVLVWYLVCMGLFPLVVVLVLDRVNVGCYCIGLLMYCIMIISWE